MRSRLCRDCCPICRTRTSSRSRTGSVRSGCRCRTSARNAEHFTLVGTSEWDDGVLRDELARQIGRELGTPDGILVFDPSGFPKSGRESVGVARQWCGRPRLVVEHGKTDNCQVAVFLGYVSRHEHALVDMRLYLPEEWTKDAARMKKAGVPQGTKFRTRHELALEMLAKHSATLPHQWITGDDEMGRPSWFRRDLRALREQYLFAVPSNTSIRDLEVEPPDGTGIGRPRKRPWQNVSKWTQAQPEAAWTMIDVRDGSKGPLLFVITTPVEMLKRRVRTRNDKRQESPDDEMLVVIRYRDRDQTTVTKTDDHLSNALPETPLAEFARAAQAEHRIEECLRRAKSEAGLADYEVRHWRGWHHHQTLSLIATWFLVTESRRGKKWTPAITLPQLRAGISQILHRECGCATAARIQHDCQRRLQRNELARYYHHKQRNMLPPLNINKRQI